MTEIELQKTVTWYQYMMPQDHPDEHTSNIKANTLWQGFKQRSTAHGVPHIDLARGPIKKFFWILATLTCVGVLIYHLSYISLFFFDYRVDVVVKLVHKRELTFPAISVCNMNPIRLSSVQNYSGIEQIVNGNNIVDPFYNEDGKLIREEFRLEERLISVVAELTEAQQIAIGHQLDDFMVDCQYAGSDCFPREFVHFYDPLYGNCYTYNSGWMVDGSVVESSRRAGRRHGFKMVFNIEQDEYVDELVQSAGVRIVVHPQDRMPFPQDEGILATPGMLTSIGIRQIMITRLGKPHGNCTDPTVRNVSRNVWEEYFPVKYSSSACHKTCYQRYVIERCNCADPAYPMYGTAFENKTVIACDVIAQQQATCKLNVTHKYQTDQLECDCPVPCDETAYSFEVSSVQWPSNVNKELIMEKYKDNIPKLIEANNSMAIEDNLLKVEVYFQEFNFETVEERPAYKIANYLSDIGGILGLWIGCSVLSAFEFFELGMDLIVRGYYFCRRDKPMSTKSKHVRKSETTDEKHARLQEFRDENVGRTSIDGARLQAANFERKHDTSKDPNFVPPGEVPSSDKGLINKLKESGREGTAGFRNKDDITSRSSYETRADCASTSNTSGLHRSNSSHMSSQSSMRLSPEVDGADHDQNGKYKNPYFPLSPPPSYSSVYNLRSSSTRPQRNVSQGRQSVGAPDLSLV